MLSSVTAQPADAVHAAIPQEAGSVKAVRACSACQPGARIGGVVQGEHPPLLPCTSAPDRRLPRAERLRDFSQAPRRSGVRRFPSLSAAGALS